MWRETSNSAIIYRNRVWTTILFVAAMACDDFLKGNSMRRLQFWSPFLILFLGILTTAQAETVIPAKLSVTDAVALSLTENVDLKAATEGRHSSVSRLKIAQLNTSYSVGSTVNLQNSPADSSVSNLVYTNMTYKNALGTEATVDLSPIGVGSERGGVGLLIRQPLTKGKGDLSSRGNQILSAKNDVVIHDYDLFQSQQSTVVGVVDAYYNAVLAQEKLKVQESAVTLAEEVADATRKREEAGLMTGIQVSRADINVARVKNSLNIERTSARGAVDRLMLAIGFGIGQAPELTDPIPEVIPEMPTLEKAIDTALVNRTELRAYDIRISNQQRDLAMRKDEFRPGINAVARFNSTNTDTGLLSSSLFNIGTSVAGLEVTMPLDTRAIRENQDISARSLQILNEQRTYQTEQIAEEVRTAYRGYESAKISLDIYGQNLVVAQDGLHIAQRMVEEGEGDNREVLDAQQALTDVQEGLLSAKNELYMACIRLKHAMGEDLTKMGSK